MEIRVANYAGFCEGVRRAVGMALDLAQKSTTPLYTIGELIHNPQVIELLRKKGVLDVREPGDAQDGSVLIRSHGISPALREQLQGMGINTVDGTCPHVLRIHSIIKKAADSDAMTVVVGDAGHAEVEALRGCAGENGYVVASSEEVDSLPDFSGPVCVVAQSTQEGETFDRIAGCLKERYPQAEVHQTICLATRLRQEAVRELAGGVEAVVVVGGRNSANTARLAQVAQAAGAATYHVETPEELDNYDFSKYSRVGVTAGASTPNWIIRKVVNYLSKINRGPLDKLFEPARFLVRFLALSNIYVASGAAALTCAASVLLRVGLDWRYPVMAFFSILSLHTVNQYLAAKEASSLYLRGPVRLVPLLRMFAAGASAAAAVIIAVTVGPLEAVLIALALAVGSIYGVQVAPAAFRRIIRLRSLRDIPASKDVFAAAGWAMLVAFLPAIPDWPSVGLTRLLAVFALVFMMVYIRSTLLDVGEIERDRAVGREATPFVLGKRRTKFVLASMVAGMFLLLSAGYFAGVLSGLALWFYALVLYTMGYLFLYHQRLVTREMALELLVDGKFLLAGALALLWAGW